MALALVTGCGGDPGGTSGAKPLAWQHEHVAPAPANALRGHVDTIIDGDTLMVTVESQTVTVRLLGVDTPEKVGGPRPAECFGAEATAFTAAMVPVGTAVGLSRDAETRDQYGRLLAWVHRDDGVLVNLALVESGHAVPLFFSPNDQLEPLFERAGWAARRQQRGLWPACGGDDLVIGTD